MFRVKYCRESALKILFQLDSIGFPENLSVPELMNISALYISGLDEEEIKFTRNLVEKAVSERPMIDQLIERNLIGWKLDRLLAIDRCIMRLGIAESFFNNQRAIIIDDFIRIAKKYAEKDSYKLINAVLDKVLA